MNHVLRGFDVSPIENESLFEPAFFVVHGMIISLAVLGLKLPLVLFML